jgi:Arc/MetJ family transcription regulator
MEAEMRTNIDLDDKLVAKAMKLSGLKTKKAVVDEALQRFVKEREQIKKQKRALKFFGKIPWEENLDEMRTDIFDDEVEIGTKSA